jgi:hypothetical protein
VVAYYAPDGVMPEPEPTRPAPVEWQLDLTGPMFSLPGRDYYLFEGEVESWFDPQSPHFCWPADHAWCVATEVDFDSTFIGGSRARWSTSCPPPSCSKFSRSPRTPHAKIA